MYRRTGIALVLILTPALAACGDSGRSEPDPFLARGKTLTIYAGIPRHGPEAGAAAESLAGMRAALRAARGRAGDRRVRLAVVPTTRPGDDGWDPGTVEAAAERARDDPSAIAYIGEHDPGASAVSLPVTNGRGLLQVSPADSLTSLTRSPPGRPRAGPSRFYPEGRRTFLRLVEPDIEVARGLLSRAGRSFALLSSDDVADRELAGMIASVARRRGHPPVAEQSMRGDDPDVEAIAEDLAAPDPAVVILAVGHTPAAAELVRALRARRPGIELLGGPRLARPGAGPDPGIAVLTQRPPLERLDGLLVGRARSLGLGSTEEVYGYVAMQLVLRAVRAGGRDRRAVSASAVAPGIRTSELGAVVVQRRGEGLLRGGRLALLR